MKFVWDPEKASVNLKKHGVSFEDGIEVFDDLLEITWFDKEHSDEEERLNTIGETSRGILFVGYAVRDETIRIITVRRATSREKADYYEN